MLKNRGLAFKLGCGFGLLILLAVIVAGVGALSLNQLLERSAKMQTEGFAKIGFAK
ncbi:MAG: hypothetical protein ACP59X_09005 [Solidesulfovibrio sp. DCME]|uniref:hypothetical protein n=1 Tax=Solidesulfovibrio sp. DCME TaxID=3447380 RepID=UPI003D14D04E